jgi:hypothetical protein
MLERRGYIASGILHLGLVLLFILGFPNLFGHRLPEETPLVVQLVKIGPETRATQLTKTPPIPQAKPEPAEEPSPKPPRVMPQFQPPPMLTPPEPQLATPEPPPPAPQPKPKPPAPIPPVPALKPPTPPEVKPVNVHVPSPKPQPPKAKPKPDETQQFDALLKNLAKNDPMRSAPDQPRQNHPYRQPSSQPIAPLGAQLTASELDLVKEQIEQCWDVPAGAREAQDLRPEFRVYMNSDGTVRTADLLNQEQLGDPVFRAAADAAYRALKNPACQPLKLPPDKFDQWQTFTITFDPKDIAG